MAETPETKTVSAHDLGEVQKVVNRITLNRVASRVDANPAAGLTDLLSTQLKEYPGLVETLAQSVRIKSPEPKNAEPKNAEPKDGGGTRGSDDGQESLTAAESLSVSAELPVEILYTLISRLLELVFSGDEVRAPDDWSESLAGDFVAALNRHLAEAECLHELHPSFFLGLGPSVAAKVSPFLDIDHLSNLRHINSRVPDTPVPQCLVAFRNSDQSYFLSRAPGVTLESIWSDLTTSHKLSVQSQLNSIFRALRMQTQDAQGDYQPRLGSFETGICKDTRRMQRVSEDPIRIEVEFNNFLCHKLGRTVTSWIKMIHSSLREDHRIVLTHGDLHPRNIMVSWEGDQGGILKVTAILGWEFAGWYPEYWEFVKALNTIRTRGPLSDWIDFLPTDAIGSYLVEYSIDCILDRWLG